MLSIRECLQQFLSETGEGNRRSASSPFSIIDLFGRYLDGYAHADLREFDRARFDKEYDEGRQFCDIFGPDHIEASHINAFLNTFIPGKVMGTKSLLKACGPLMERLVAWLQEKGHWDQGKMDWFRELVGEKAGSDLSDARAFAEALGKYADKQNLPDIEDIADEDYMSEQFTIKKVETDKLHLEPDWEEGDEIVLSVPTSVSSKTREGWSVSLELVRIRGEWRILGVGNVYPW